MSDRIFATWAPKLRSRGLWVRPITPGTKGCQIPNWQIPDTELDNSILAAWPTMYPDAGICLLLGSPFPDGSVLGALDIDDDAYNRVAEAVLQNPPCGRRGARGAMFFRSDSRRRVVPQVRG